MPVERTSAGLQMVNPGCEQRSLPRSPTPADQAGQGLLGFDNPPSLREILAGAATAPLQPRRGQRPPPRSGPFSQGRISVRKR